MHNRGRETTFWPMIVIRSEELEFRFSSYLCLTGKHKSSLMLFFFSTYHFITDCGSFRFMSGLSCVTMWPLTPVLSAKTESLLHEARLEFRDIPWYIMAPLMTQQFTEGPAFFKLSLQTKSESGFLRLSCVDLFNYILIGFISGGK